MGFARLWRVGCAAVALAVLAGGCGRAEPRSGRWATVVTVTSDRAGVRPPTASPGPARVVAVDAEETAICSGALDTPEHQTLITAEVSPPRAGVEVEFELTDPSPATKPATLSSTRAVTDPWGVAETTLTSSNTPDPHQSATVRASVVGQPREPNGPHAEVEFMVATNLDLPGRGPVAVRPQKVSPTRYARHPSLVRVAGTLYLLWTETPRMAGGGRRFVLSGRAWPVRWQAVEPAGGRRGLLLLPTAEAQLEGQRVAVCGLDRGLLLAFPQSHSTARGNPKAALQHLPGSALVAAPVDASAAERAVLAPGLRLTAPLVSAPGPTGSLPLRPGNPPVWSDAATDARRYDLAAATGGQRVYCCGEDWSKGGGLWLTFSDDGARRWAPFAHVPGEGIYPCITVARGRVVLLYVRVSDRRLQSQWPDDADDLAQMHATWADSGSLILRTIGADLRGWSRPTTVAATGVISARCAADASGRLWVVYVTGDEVRQATTLWLSHSDDLGQSWSAPEQVTDGQTIDRDPFLLVEHDALYLAFARGREFAGRTDVVLLRRGR